MKTLNTKHTEKFPNLRFHFTVFVQVKNFWFFPHHTFP